LTAGLTSVKNGYQVSGRWAGRPRRRPEPGDPDRA
jgi:hypothetical protein